MYEEVNANIHDNCCGDVYGMHRNTISPSSRRWKHLLAHSLRRWWFAYSSSPLRSRFALYVQSPFSQRRRQLLAPLERIYCSSAEVAYRPQPYHSHHFLDFGDCGSAHSASRRQRITHLSAQATHPRQTSESPLMRVVASCPSLSLIGHSQSTTIQSITSTSRRICVWLIHLFNI